VGQEALEVLVAVARVLELREQKLPQELQIPAEEVVVVAQIQRLMLAAAMVVLAL
jgi:hypothetical protein